MPGQWGGYRKPSNPAPVSGPGAHSQRTDGQPVAELPNAEYGSGKEFRQLQQGAPLAAGPSMPQRGAAMGAAMSQLTGLGAPSAQPNTPVTDGANAGLGRDSSAIGADPNLDRQDAQAYAKYVPVLLQMAERDSAAPGFKQWVRNLLANL